MLGLKWYGRLGCRLGVWVSLALASLSGCTAGEGAVPGAGGTGTNTGPGGTGVTVPSGAPGAGGSNGPSAATPVVGLITLRRLNRVEYGNTLRDLTGTTTDYGAKFPPENLSFGFDNIGEALTVQPLNVELYEESAEAVLTELFARPAADPVRNRFLTCDAATGRSCVIKVLQGFAQYAYRRPVAEAEIGGLADIAQDFVTSGGKADEGLKLALKGVLLSPHFIYRVELDADPTSNVVHPVSAFELATRLSYYLWSTTPDSTLLVEAQNGNLLSDAGLSAQIDRLLSDARSSALLSNFVGQWLNLRRTEQVKPDEKVYPSFDDELRASLRQESEKFFGELLQKERPISELLTGSFTYINKRLATHYGLPAPATDGFVRVDLSGSARVGFLTQASYLTATSNPTRTSPVKRGKWVLDQLLCTPPPPPPANVDLGAVEVGDTSLRKRLEQHRAKEPCNSCHAIMDPIGLSFENFDGIGTYRTSDQYGPIDATGQLRTADGVVSFNGAAELMPILAKDARLADCFAQKLLTYAVGRGFSGADAGALKAVADSSAALGAGVRGVFKSVALSEAFRSRRAVAP